MSFKFLHVSDVHLGFQQYNHRERFNDFGRAFLHVVDQAIDAQVDFVILAGDLFQKRSVDPPTLLQAIGGLSRLREAGIPVAAVEGNHERAHYRDVFSWMEFLADQGYLALLNPVSFQEGVPVLTAWDGSQGAYLDTVPSRDSSGPLVRIYGVSYYGAATPRMVEGLVKALGDVDHAGIAYVILIMHAGVEGVLPRYSATLTHDQLAPLRGYIDYLALGHIHKHFERDGWIYNPGSPETCSMDEVAWPERGYYMVEVDTAFQVGTSRETQHVARLLANPRRPFLRLALTVDTFTGPEAIYAGVEARVAQEAAKYNGMPVPPVVELGLDGVLPFHRHELDLKRLETLVDTALKPLLVRINNRTVPTEFEVGGDESRPRAELEREVIEDLVERDVRYRAGAADWTELILDVKRMVREGTPPQNIVEYLKLKSQPIDQV